MSLVERLREGQGCTTGCNPKICGCAAMEDAADRIAELEAALTDCARCVGEAGDLTPALIAELPEMIARQGNLAGKLVLRVSELEAENARMRELLEPMAACAHRVPEYIGDNDWYSLDGDGMGSVECKFPAGHLRAAAAKDGNRRMQPHLKSDARQMDEICKLAISQSLRDRYERKATIRSDNGLAVVLAMNAETAQSFFKLREVPEGMRRRSALRNWVSEHIRFLDDSRATTVREHLRNRVQFDWAGFECEYRPSLYDEERNDSLRDAKIEKRLGSARA